MMDTQIPLQIEARFLPMLNAQNQKEIFVQANFSLNITEDFGIEGPDGPSPNRETLLFNLFFRLTNG